MFLLISGWVDYVTFKGPYNPKYSTILQFICKPDEIHYTTATFWNRSAFPSSVITNLLLIGILQLPQKILSNHLWICFFILWIPTESSKHCCKTSSPLENFSLEQSDEFTTCFIKTTTTPTKLDSKTQFYVIGTTNSGNVTEDITK